MGDTSVTKVNSAHSPKGAMGQKYLASGVHIAMRLWEAEAPDESKPPTQRDYETVGYVISGRAELYQIRFITGLKALAGFSHSHRLKPRLLGYPKREYSSEFGMTSRGPDGAARARRLMGSAQRIDTQLSHP